MLRLFPFPAAVGLLGAAVLLVADLAAAQDLAPPRPATRTTAWP